MDIINNSNDKKYFTQVPNFILNHSTAVDQALYLQMKRITGEKEKCKAGEKYFLKQLGIGRKALKKSLEYLIEHEWIIKIGKEPVMTEGGEQAINCYIVNDIWKMNTDYYFKGVSESEHLDSKGVSESTQRGVQKELKGVSKRDNKEEPKKEELRTYATPEVVAEAKTFNLEEETDKLVNSKVEHLPAIGLFIDIQELKPANSAQLSSIIKRNSRSACLLKGYSKEQIIHTMSLLKKYADFRWTLESVGKYIDKPEEIKKLIK